MIINKAIALEVVNSSPPWIANFRTPPSGVDGGGVYYNNQLLCVHTLYAYLSALISS